MNEYDLYRCKFIKIKGNFIVGRGIFDNKLYYIKINKYSKKFKIGTDNYFYATKKEKGIILKKTILSVVDYNKVINEKNDL